jgi:hypothetical protein
MRPSGPEQKPSRTSPAYNVVLTVLLATFLALALSSAGYAQGDDETSVGHVALPTPPGTDLQFGHLSMEQGLSNNIVWSVLQDSRGFILSTLAPFFSPTHFRTESS